jgi:hypothetical protein
MEIQIEVTKQDFIDFNLYHLSHSPTIKRQRIALLLPGFLWSGFWLWLCVDGAKTLHNIKTLMPLIIGGFLYVATLLILWRGSMKRQIQRLLSEGENKGLLGSQRVIISEEGIANIDELSTYTAKWQTVEKVIASDNCLYIYVSAVSALIVPKRFFASDAAFADFVRQTTEYAESVRQ